ncbi:sarcosine oxidase subunit alpha family protein [Bradyrhizobium sp.]|uniref:sarcosine oxidase subunit alpha family protein n=1 Tax=Bradyrhizobium sp. TaxID=376 RepID=UPI003C3F98D7
MTQPFRIGEPRRPAARRVRFSFDGRSLEGQEGDTLAAALLANGVHMMARSYKYHRPRGVLTAGAEEPNALVAVSRGGGRFTPNLRATQVGLYDGLDARSQHCWPSLRFDIGAINGLFPALLSAGFYYKTFMGPRVLGGAQVWTRLFEPVIRRAAGLGSAPTEPDADRYAQFYDHCDVLIVGAGPAGLAAAKAAGECGARVILCDEQAEPGGSLLAERSAIIDGQPASEWLASVLRALRWLPNVRLMPRTQAFGAFAQNFVALNERVTDHLASPSADLPRERLWQVRAKHVVLAAGAIERPLVFPDNDRPGVMLADSARCYLNRYGVRVGAQAVIATAHDSAYRVALDLVAGGVEVPLIADLRPTANGALPQLARDAGLRIATGTRIEGTRGRRRVSEVTITAGGCSETVACDALLMSGGWTPSVHLYSQARGRPVFDAGIGAFVPGTAIANQTSAGGCNGTFGLANVLAEGSAAGRAAAGATRASGPSPAVSNAPEAAGIGLVTPEALPGASAFVDFQNDVCAKDIALAVREGMQSIEHVKRYTTTGMATDQGKTSNLNAMALVADKLGRTLPAVGHTAFRQPYTPVTFGVFAGAARGQLFDPVRRTPIHGWAEQNGAVFEDVGLWKRAWYFPKLGEDMHAAVARECRQTRASVGMLDASTLGKIEVVGPDAAAFMERIYTNPWAKLAPGRCRYGLMLNEAGFVIDDGVVARIGPDRFHVTTTTGGAPRVLAHMEDYLQTEFPELQVWLTSTTEQWAVIAVQGPRARDLVAPLIEGFDVSNEAMPHMSVRDGRFCGIPARVMRVSFTGELGYEINLPSDYGRAAWEVLWERGKAHDCVAYGTEAMHVMRAEKGYIIVGQETDGTVTPADLGLEWAIGKAKADFVGKRSLVRPDMLSPDRPQLVGLLTARPGVVIEEGAQIVTSAEPKQGEHAIGHVTSSYMSPALGRSIALALVEGGRRRIGNKLFTTAPQGTIAVELVEPVFFDKQGERANG